MKEQEEATSKSKQQVEASGEEEFILEELLQDKELRTHLQKVIDAQEKHYDFVEKSLKDDQRLRSTPILKIRREGNLNVDYLLAEFQRVQDRTSQLSANQRNAVAALVWKALQSLMSEKIQAKMKTVSAESAEEIKKQEIQTSKSE